MGTTQLGRATWSDPGSQWFLHRWREWSVRSFGGKQIKPNRKISVFLISVGTLIVKLHDNTEQHCYTKVDENNTRSTIHEAQLFKTKNP